MRNSATQAAGSRSVYWHRDLPPLDAEAIGEHTVEASSPRVPGNLANRDALWSECERGLTREVELRLAQEVARLGGRCARVLDEHVEVKRDPSRDEAWLHGRYVYMLYG